MRLLVLAAADDDVTNLLVKLALDARGIPYNTITVPNGAPIQLIDSNNEPLYCGVVFTDRYIGPTGPGRTSVLSAEQAAALESFESTFGIPEVVLNAYPSAESGTALTAGQIAAVGNFAIEMGTTGKMYSWGIADRSAMYGAWSAPAQITSANTTSLATLHNVDSGANLGSGVVLCSFNTALVTQHKRMEFYFDLSVWSLASHLYANLWVQFVTHGVYLGQRRVYMPVQVHDFFSQSFLWSETELQESVDSARLTQTDYAALVAYRQTALAAMPVGSQFTFEMFFNGASGNGSDAHNDGGALRDYVKAHSSALLWASQTWDNENLDTASKGMMDDEIELNVQFAETELLLLNASNWETTTICTNQLSGLGNANVLRSMSNHQITSACSDPNVNSDYYGTWYDDGQGHKVFGVPSSQRLFANCMNGSQLASEYNFVNAVNLTFEQILLTEATKTLENLVALDWRAQRFSQANLIATTEGTRTGSLLSMWLDVVLQSYSFYSTLPIYSLSQSVRSTLYQQRQTRDDCIRNGNIAGHFNVSEDRRTFESVTIACSCANANALVTVPGTIGLAYGGAQEHYGNDLTLSVPSGAAATVVNIGAVWSDGIAAGGGVVTSSPAVTTTTPAATTITAAPTTTVATTTQKPTTTQPHTTAQAHAQATTQTQTSTPASTTTTEPATTPASSQPIRTTSAQKSDSSTTSSMLIVVGVIVVLAIIL